MVMHSLNHILRTVTKVVGEKELLRVSRYGAYWSSCFWRARDENPMFLWGYHQIRALDIWKLQGRADAVKYLHEHNIYD